MHLEWLKRRARNRRDAIVGSWGYERRNRGFFIPYPYVQAVDRHIESYPAVAALFAAKTSAFRAWIKDLGARIDDLKAIEVASPDRWRTLFFAPRDAAAAYVMVRSTRPRRILEIGSGTSTWFMAKAVADGKLDCEITCIDPAPRAEIADLGVRHVPRALRPEDASLAARLGPGDILFIDSSHLMLPGMDVDIQFNLMFPSLAPGVIVHVHDIFLPYDYPDAWQDRMYSEQNALVGWLCSGYFDVLYPGQYASRNLAADWKPLVAAFPVLAEEAAGSIWLRRHQGQGPATGD